MKKTLKDPKGSFLFTSMVASAALAPILTGQMEIEQNKKENNHMEPIIPLTSNASKLTSLTAQGVYTFPRYNTISHNPNDKENDNILIAKEHDKRKSNVIQFAAIIENATLPHPSKIENDDESTSELIWPEDTILSLGDKNSKVETIQQHLKEIGYYVYDIDGIFGNKTLDAVKLYQKDHGLTIDGIVGKETIEKIVGTKKIVENENKIEENFLTSQIFTPEELKVYINPQMLEMNKNNEKKTYFEYGDESEEIASIQEKLKKAQYYSGPIDGVFGSGTQQAVRALQRDYGLTVDGILGNEVKNFLESNDLQKIAHRKNKNETKTNNAKEEVETTPANNHSSQINSVENIIALASNLKGTPYIWGGTSPSGFDCSGFIVYVFEQNDISLPRTVKGIWNATTSISTPSRGDLVFFETYTSGPSHVGIYLGNGSFIHSGTSTGVTISNMDNSYWKSRYLGARTY